MWHCSLCDIQGVIEGTDEHDTLMGHAETLFPPALAAADADTTWSPDSDSVIVVFDQCLQGITNDCNLFDFSEMEPATQATVPGSKPPRLMAGEHHILDLFQGHSSDSVGTFSGHLSMIPPQSPMRLELDSDNEGNDDDVSWQTM